MRHVKLTNAFIVIALRSFAKYSLAMRTVAAPIAAKKANNIPYKFNISKLGPIAIPRPKKAEQNPTIWIVVIFFPL